MAITIGAGQTTGSSTQAGGIPNLPFSSPSNLVSIAAAQCVRVASGPHIIDPGAYAELQVYDSNVGAWQKADYPNSAPFEIDSDGSNYRIINTTGCPVGAIITNKGSGYTNGIGVATCTAGAGGSLWTVITGGSINTTVTVTAAGVYNYVPTITFSAPPAGGVRASGIAVLSGATIGSVTVVDAGAGYTTAPTITITPDPRETGTGGGVLTVNATLANSGAITAIVCTDPGTAPQTSAPTLTIAGGGGSSGAATALMNWVVTGFTVTTKGSSFGNSAQLIITSGNPLSTATSAVTDPDLDTGIAASRMARLLGFTNSTGNIIASNTSLITIDSGWGFQQVPSLFVQVDYAATTGPTSVGLVAATVGGITDQWSVQRVGV